MGAAGRLGALSMLARPQRTGAGSGRRLLAFVVIALAAVLGPKAGPGAEALAPPAQEDPSKPSSSRAARDSAVQSIPLGKLTAEGKAKAAWVLANSGVFRRLPIRVVQCDPDLYLFLVQHPDVVVNIWEVLGVSHLTMQQTGRGTYCVTDDIGTTGTLEVLHQSHDTHVVYIDGTYTGPIFGRSIRARGLMVLKTGYVRETDGHYYVTSRLDAFLNIEPGGIEFLTKTFLPAVGKVADNNFLQTAGFLGSISRTAEVNSRGVQRLAARLSKVQPDVRLQFAQLADQVARRAANSASAAPRRAEDGPLAIDKDPAALKVARRETEAARVGPKQAGTPSKPTP